ncbi:MAG TPA: hypothetical protein VGN84_02160 [Solirubrobacterales bacterium]|jgi:hypothetical protein|nr:hypothetical protein [Solirubrobacterales bacterium]
MSQGRHGIKILGLALLAAVSVMAVTAASAMATGEYKLEAKTFTAAGLAKESVAGTGGLGILLVPAIKLELHCTGADVTSSTVLLGGVAHATVLFLGCTVLKNSFCHVYPTKAEAEKDSGTGLGDITASGLGLLRLHGSPVVHYLEVEGPEGGTKPFTTIFFGGAECTLPIENKVTGKTAFKLPGALTPAVNQTLESINEATGTLLGVQLKFGLNNAFIHGGTFATPTTASVHLSGANVGKTWGSE